MSEAEFFYLTLGKLIATGVPLAVVAYILLQIFGDLLASYRLRRLTPKSEAPNDPD